jgi:hypothetical protein
MFYDQAFDESWAERTLENAVERVATFNNNEAYMDESGRMKNTSGFGGGTLVEWEEVEMTCKVFS